MNVEAHIPLRSEVIIHMADPETDPKRGSVLGYQPIGLTAMVGDQIHFFPWTAISAVVRK